MIEELYKPNYPKVMQAVQQLINQFSIIEPPIDPVQIARQLGMTVNFASFIPEMNNVSGFYDPEENAIYVNRDEAPLRQTFTVAHELGHKQLHQEWAESNNYRVLLRSDDSNSDDPREKEANAFAGNLLVPRFLLDRYWKDVSREQLSKLFAVSVPVINARISLEYGA